MNLEGFVLPTICNSNIYLRRLKYSILVIKEVKQNNRAMDSEYCQLQVWENHL